MALDKNDLKAIGNLIDNKIDGLGRMIKKEFDFMHSEFDFMHKEFDAVHKEMDISRINIDNKFASANENISRISFEITQIKFELKKERKWTVEDVDLMEGRIDSIESEVNKIKLKLKTT